MLMKLCPDKATLGSKEPMEVIALIFLEVQPPTFACHAAGLPTLSIPQNTMALQEDCQGPSTLAAVQPGYGTKLKNSS
eukprot:scaffold78426_cov12-Tisochrysis_lutea.AAC.2